MCKDTAEWRLREASMQEIFDKAFDAYNPSDDGEAILLYLAGELRKRFGYQILVREKEHKHV